jgi:hypothetical protein
VLSWAQDNYTKGRDARKDGGNANETGRDFRSRKKPFRSNDNRDDNHHERIHDSRSKLNRHRRGAADTTRRTLFAAKPKTGFVLGA